MAEILVSSLFQVVFEKLADEGLKQLARSQGIHSELNDLEMTLSHIQALLNDASHKEISDESVKKWLNGLQHLAYDIDDVLDDLATDVMHHECTEQSGAVTSKVRKLVPTCCMNFSLSHRLCPKLDDITTKLRNLEKQTLSLGLIVKDEKPKYTSRRSETSLPDASSIVGRHGEKEKLLQRLLGDEDCDQKFTIIPIVGMGGVGKTTLARLLYNETQVNDHFELKAWVCVSDDFDVFKISKTIFQAVTRENRKFSDLNGVQMALVDQLKDKKILLVLDDIWTENYDDWENLVRPVHSGALGSKIIMTTRKETLLKKLGYDHLDHLTSLSHDDALSLFALHALGVDNFDSHVTLKPLGVGIVNKCGGLPLALKALGRLLTTVKDEDRWEAILNSEIWDLENKDEIVPALRLSYQELKASLKQLFAYCSLFPKDFLFDKEELVLLWMAEGFLSQTTGNISAERLGHEYFEMLVSRSFFQEAPNEKSLFVMHDLMNDLAKCVAGEYFLRFDNRMEIAKEAFGKYHHMSFICEEYVAYKKFEAFKKAKSLRTFIAVSLGVLQSRDILSLSNKILTDLLPELQLLRVLCLSCFNITEVPEFIGNLTHLRYLNLSQTEIKELPKHVGNLYNLQTLIVFGCWKLTKLPKSFLKLKKLRHFDIRDTPLLKVMPLGIGVLTNLQTLTKIIIGGYDGFTITDLKGLKNLHGKISIEGLDKVQSAIHAREANLSLKRLTELELEWGDVFDGSRKEALEKEVLNELKPDNNKLKKLGIVSYGGIEFPNWVGNSSFCQLIHVSIRGCRKCTSFPALGKLPLLKELRVKGMNKVIVISSELLGTTGVAFPSLEILQFEDMPRWEVWSTNSGIVDVVFPRLQKLLIKNCPNLVDISLEAFPSLGVLKVGGCGDGVLRSLVRVASSITELQIESISGLTDEGWRSVIEFLGAVEELKVSGCDEIRYLWESEAKVSKVLVNLRKLVVSQNSNLVSLGEKEEDDDNFGSNLLTSLTVLDISNCESMKRCRCPNSIESLRIFMCSSITRVSFSTATVGGQKLKSLRLFGCTKQMETISNTNMPMLKYVHIYRWTHLKSITELSCSMHLTHLMIQDCPILESFPDLQLSNLTTLKHIIISNCPSIDVSFPRGIWPPKLSSLEIGGLKKPITEWGNQNFPMSLVELQLLSEDVRNFSQLSHLLPSSLTLLHITEFTKLESLSMGLQHLTSIQHLIIHECPKLINLPETLLPSLLRFVTYGCPKLEKKTRRGSYYWSLISHIPYISTEDEDED